MPKISTEEIIAASALLSLISVIIPILTPYLKYSIIFSLIKSGMNNQGVPSAMLVATLSLLLAYNDLSVVIKASIEKYQELPAEQSIAEKVQVLQSPFFEWIKPQVPEKYHKNLLAGYIISQIDDGLKIGLKIFVIFLAIDLLIAIILACLGLQMLSPQGLSFALKIVIIIQSEFFAHLISTLSHGRLF